MVLPTPVSFPSALLDDGSHGPWSVEMGHGGNTIIPQLLNLKKSEAHCACKSKTEMILLLPEGVGVGDRGEAEGRLNFLSVCLEMHKGIDVSQSLQAFASGVRGPESGRHLH